MSDSDSDEFIRNIKTITQFGRVSRPRYQVKSINMSTPVTTTITSVVTQPTTTTTNTSTIMSPSILERDIVNAMPRTSTIIAGADLPMFRGRKRINDPVFTETKSFRTHVDNLKSYMTL